MKKTTTHQTRRNGGGRPQYNPPPLVVNSDDIHTPVKVTVNVPPIVYILAFIVLVAMASLVASVR